MAQCGRLSPDVGPRWLSEWLSCLLPLARSGARVLRDHAVRRAWVVFPRIAGDKCSPGFLASFFPHVPLGVSYIRALNADQGLTRGDIVKGAAYTAAFAAIAVAGPNIVGSDRNSPHAFTPAQMGPHDVEAAKEPPVTG